MEQLRQMGSHDIRRGYEMGDKSLGRRLGGMPVRSGQPEQVQLRWTNPSRVNILSNFQIFSNIKF